ncbi:hypothetical protein PGB90_003453 [Kerria lacca]
MNQTDYVELNVVVHNIFPYLSVEENETIIISGYMGELWSIIENALYFKNNFIKTRFDEGKQLLMNGSADVMLLPSVVTNTDVDEFEVSVPVAKSWYELYTKRKGDGATSVSYVETWNSSLWLAFLSTIVTLSIILWIMLKTRTKYGLDDHKTTNFQTNISRKKKQMLCNNQNTTLLETRSITLWTCFLIVLGTITNQGNLGFNINTKSTSLRIIMLVVLFFGLLMLNSYSAVLVSRLAVEKDDILFLTLKSIIDKNTHVLCIRESSYAYLMFKENERDTELMPIWRSIINQHPCENTTSVADIATVLCEDDTVVLETPHIIASIFESPKCLITRMPGRYATAYTTLLMKKGFKFKKKINELLQKLQTAGIIDYLQRKWLSRRIPQNSNLSSNKPVTINHINGVLLVYGLVIILALAILFVEKIARSMWVTRKRPASHFKNGRNDFY